MIMLTLPDCDVGQFSHSWLIPGPQTLIDCLPETCGRRGLERGETRVQYVIECRNAPWALRWGAIKLSWSTLYMYNVMYMFLKAYDVMALYMTLYIRTVHDVVHVQCHGIVMIMTFMMYLSLVYIIA